MKKPTTQSEKEKTKKNKEINLMEAEGKTEKVKERNNVIIGAGYYMRRKSLIEIRNL